MKFLPTGAVLMLAIVSSSAGAAVVKYQYSAQIASMSEKTSGISGWRDVNSSNVLGKRLSIGDTMAGSLAYDSDVELSSYQPDQGSAGTYTLYDADIKGLMSLGDKGLSYDSSKLIYVHGLVLIADNASAIDGGDMFGLHSYSFGPGAYSSVDLTWWDNSGKAFSGNTVPDKVLDWADFDRATISYSWNDASGNALSLTGWIVNDSVDVPEPGSLPLVFAGLGMLGCAVSRRAKTNK